MHMAIYIGSIIDVKLAYAARKICYTQQTVILEYVVSCIDKYKYRQVGHGGLRLLFTNLLYPMKTFAVEMCYYALLLLNNCSVN